MDEQMIVDIAKAIRLGRFERNGRGAAYDPDLPLHETEIADARAAHSVMAGKVAELEGALKLWLAYDDQDEADFAKAGPMLLYARAIEATRAALAPHPKGME